MAPTSKHNSNNMNRFSKFKADVICEYHPLFKGLMWVAAARSTDEERPVLNSIHIERDGLDCHIVATDGRRMHVHTFEPGMFDDDIDMIESGDYEVIDKKQKLIIIAPAECGSEYPNWRTVLPKGKTRHSEVINSQTIAKMCISTGVLLANGFASDAIGFRHGRKADDSVLVSFGSEDDDCGGPFLIQHDLGKAVVMPLKIYDDEDKERKLGQKDNAEKDEDKTPDLPTLSDTFKSFKDSIPPGSSVTIEGCGKSITIDGDSRKGGKKKA